VKDLLALHDKFMAVVNGEFCCHSLFQKALKDAFVEVVNKDVGKFKNADLLSSFCDRLLKTGSSEKLSDAETEEYLEKTVQMFSYLTDKDLFAEIYRNQLAKRLLNSRSASDEMERMMIGKLKLKCGSQFTAKMEGMMNDLAIGLDTAKSFDEYIRTNEEARQSLGRMEFAVQVLTSGHWPTYKNIDLNLPPVMTRCTNLFKQFYEASSNHKRLQWTYMLGSTVVKGTFGKRSYDIQLGTLQAAALLAFNVESPGSNSNEPKSFDSLVKTLGMPEDVLKRVMHSLSCLAKVKVLRRISESSSVADVDKNNNKQEALIKTTDSFIFNEHFRCTHKRRPKGALFSGQEPLITIHPPPLFYSAHASHQMRKIRIPMASLEESHNRERVEEDRTLAIEAAIVRIMKARKTLAHQQLVGEVLTQLSFFKPDPKVIKKRIEGLIDREYLERDEHNTSVYRYLA